MKLFLLDAYALIYRAYYAFIKSPLTNSKGQHTSTVWGFLNTLEDVLTRERPTHIGVAFDPKGGTFRHEAYPQYKAQRQATPEDIAWSVPVIKQLLAAYRIPVLEVAGFEADDVIGTLAAKAGAQGIDTFMMTPDKDYGQLVTDRVRIYRPRHSQGQYEVMGPHEVCAKYGLKSTDQVVDLLGLMGDASDNIPGCPGVGEKTAAKLLEQFGSIEGLLASTDQLKGAMQRKVTENAEQIRFSRFLATIRRDVPIELDLDALAVKAPDEERLRTMLADLEMRSLIKKKFGGAAPAAPAPPAPRRTPKADDGDTPDLFAAAGLDCDGNALTADSDGPQSDSVPNPARLSDSVPNPARLSVSVPGSARLSVSEELSADGVCIVSLPDLDLELPALKEALEDPTTLKVGHDLKSDINRLAAAGIELRGKLFDVMIAHYLLHPELKHDLDYMALTMLGATLATDGDAPAIGIDDQEPAIDRASAIAALYAQLKDSVQSLFTDIEMPLLRVLAQMERNGVRLHVPTLQATSADMRRRLLALEDEAQRLAGVQFNPASPKQVGEVLFDHLKIDPRARRGKGGHYSTNEDTLRGYAADCPVIPVILEYRGIKKLLSTYIDALPALINPSTGHIHTTFNQAVTVTGRLSSSNPNLQNIPIRDEEGRFIRQAFLPEEGERWFSADYSQIELRLMAHLSGDETLVADFLSGHDIHAATAAKIFHKPVDEVTKTERRRAKTANFGIIYGITTFGLAERLEMPRAEAKALIEGYFETYPGVKRYMDESIRLARERGYAETLFGRRCHLPDINSRNATVRGFAERNAINAPIQGTAADIIKMAMVRVQQRMWDERLRSRLILQVHDELNFSVPPGEEERLQALVIEEMQNVVSLRVPLIAEAGWGANWLQAH